MASLTLSSRLRNKGENGGAKNTRHAFTGLKDPWLYWVKLRSSPLTLHDAEF